MVESSNPPGPGGSAWCGRSWEGLVERRRATFTQARALGDATRGDVTSRAGEFLAFFECTGIDLFRDEEEWIFRSLRPTPRVVIEALEDHIEISSRVHGLIQEASSGSVDVEVVRRLGAFLERHLVMEEEELRPLTLRTSISGAGR